VSGAKDENRLRLENGVTCYAGRDVVVQIAVRAGEDAKLFTEIQDVRRKGGKSDQKGNTKKCFPSME
jgi:hypothetical protein